MGGLFKSHNVTTRAERLTSLSGGTSCYGGVLPVIVGTQRVNSNVIWAPSKGFKAIKHKSSTRTGKGGGSKSTSITYTYTQAIIFAIAHGYASVLGAWHDKDELQRTADLGFTVFHGAWDQAAWSVLPADYPDDVCCYPGTCYAAHPALDLGESASVGAWSYLVTGYDVDTVGTPDANPADIVTRMCTDTHVGIGVSSLLADLTGYRKYCHAMGWWMSVNMDEQKAFSEWMGMVLEATNSDPVWAVNDASTDLVLRILPRADVTVTGNNVTYAPDLTPVYSLQIDDFLDEDEPVRVEILDPSDTYNCFEVTFCDQTADYEDCTVSVHDPVDSALRGIRKGSSLSYPCITRVKHANEISLIKAQRSVSRVRKISFGLPQRFCLIEPGNYLALTVPKLGFSALLVQIESIEEDENGDFHLVTWDATLGSATPHTGSGNAAGTAPAPTHYADPGSVSAPVIFEPSAGATGRVPQVWMAVSGASDDWGGCQIWGSWDNVTYTQLGTMYGRSRYGSLSSAVAAADTSISVSFAASYGTVEDASAADAADLATLCFCDGEHLAYSDTTLTSGYTYTLAVPVRGALGTTAAAHASGASFVICDDGIFKYTYPEARIGQTLYLKFPSFNLRGLALQDLSACTAYSRVITGNSQELSAASTVTVSVGTTKPSAAAGLVFVDALGPTSPQWVKAGWTSPNNGQLGFEVAIHTGTNPDDVTARLRTVEAPAGATSASMCVLTGSAATIYASVRARYTTGFSDWSTSASSAALGSSTALVNNPMTTQYDLIAGGTDGTPVRLAKPSALTTGTYGTTTKIPQITVDTYGRITSVTELTANSGADDVFSTTEQTTNKVCLGSTVYRKVFSLGAAPNNSQNNYSHGLTGITLVNVWGWMRRSSSDKTTTTLPFASPEAGGSVGIWADNTGIYIKSGTNRSSFNAWAVLEYTKN